MMLKFPLQYCKHEYYVKSSHHNRPGTVIDVFCVLEAFGVTNPAIAHAINNLLTLNVEDKSDRLNNLHSALEFIQNAIELEIKGQNEDQQQK